MNFIAVSVYQSEARPDTLVFLNVDRIQCIDVDFEDKYGPLRLYVYYDQSYESRDPMRISDKDSIDALLAAIGMEGSL